MTSPSGAGKTMLAKRLPTNNLSRSICIADDPLTMKKKSIFLILGFLFSINQVFSQGNINEVYSQDKFELSGGFGLPEAINLKIKYGGKNIKIALGGGFLPQSEKLRTLDIGFYYHFAKKSKFTGNFVWYTLGGLNIMKFGSNSESSIEHYPYLRVGRAINFSKKTGLNVDIGACFNEYDDSPIVPSGSIGFFIRF
jgi:hypothetical protein